MTSKPDFKVMVLLLVFMQLTRDLFAIAKFLSNMVLAVVECKHIFLPVFPYLSCLMSAHIKKLYSINELLNFWKRILARYS